MRVELLAGCTSTVEFRTLAYRCDPLTKRVVASLRDARATGVFQIQTINGLANIKSSLRDNPGILYRANGCGATG